MTVPDGQLPVQERARAHPEQVLGPRTAKRLATFRDGVSYVEAGGWARLLAWLADVVVLLLGVGVGVIIVAGVGRAADLGNQVLSVGLIAVLFLVPLLYGGCCYRNGRALGAVLTGTQLVRAANGDRIGGRAAWAMLVRPLIPLLFIGAIIGALGGGGPVPGGMTSRVSVDVRATRRLRAAGIT